MGRYLERFMSLKCAGDILNAVGPFSAGAEKEISEAFAIVLRVRRFVLEAEPMWYDILDLCAGNPIASVLSVFMLPVKKAVAVDKRKIRRRYHLVKRFEYKEMNINDVSIYGLISPHTIIISSHPCQAAERIVEIFNVSKAVGLVMLPCCSNPSYNFSTKPFLKEKLGDYLTWCLYLSSKCNGKLKVDKGCLSPRNAVMEAWK